MSGLTLNDIPQIRETLKLGNVKVIKLLYFIIFDDVFDRNSRKKLRTFKGFPHDFDVDKRKKFILDKFSLSDLICVCNILNLDCTGNENELCTKILNALSNLQEFSDSIETFFSDDETETEKQNVNTDSVQTTSDANPRTAMSAKGIVESDCFYFLLRDLISNMRSFNGNDTYSVTKFLSDVEENFSFFPAVNETHKIIFLKSVLKGPAKNFINSQKGLTTYDAIKKALIAEFECRVNSADLHAQLQKRKMRNSETLFEYLIAIREIASRGNNCIDESSIIDYCINGIPDSMNNKIVLYGCNTIAEFKEKLRVYEKICNQKSKNMFFNEHSNFSSQSNYRRDNLKRCNTQTRDSDFQNRYSQNQQKQIVCFNCNSFGHISKLCPDKNRGPKCKICDNFGHKSNSCNQNMQNPNFKEVHTVQKISHLKSMCKEVQIVNTKIQSLVDTGSEISLLTENTWNRIGCPLLIPNTGVLTGFGFSKIHVIGSFNTVLTVDNCDFSLEIRVVPNQSTKFDLILGCDLIKQAQVSITPEGVFFSKPFPKTCNEVNEPFVLTINDDIPKFDLNPNVTKDAQTEVETLLNSYKPNKSKTTNIQLSITVTEDKPIFQSPRRLPFVERDIVDKQVNEWLDEKIIEPCSSEYASQVIVVRKKDGSPRICIDYRKLNRVLVKDHYPLPLIEDILDKLQESKMFSKIDLKNGFFHVPVEEKSRHYTAFVTHNGQYQFLKMPFGLSKCPSVFQRFINSAFRDLIIKGYVLPYMDDIIIPAKDETQAIERLKAVLEVASEFGLEINFHKCQFLYRKIEFLGHVISDGKLYPSPSKIKCVINYPEPKNTKDVQKFLGLSGYFRKFIPSYSLIAKPLSDLLRRNEPFQFNANEKASFEKLKNLLCQSPVLGIYRQNSPTEIHTDASIDGIAAILFQKADNDNNLHPIFYFSKKTSDAERKYTSYELEVLAVVEALKKFRIYVLGIPFKIVTDCAAFTKTLSKKDLNLRIARWALSLQDYNYTIEHRSGSKMAHVDSLSRIQVLTSHFSDSIVHKIKRAQDNDPSLAAIVELLKKGPYDDYCIKNELLYKFVDGDDIIVVPDNMQTEIIRNVHERGHFAIKRTLDEVKKQFFIPQLQSKVEQCISHCVTCLLQNHKSGKQEGYLHPLQKDDIPLMTYHVDHFGPLPTSNKNYNYIFAVIDSFTKFVWLYPTKSTTTAEVISKLNLQKTTFGNPRNIISDRGTAFTSKEFHDYCDQESISVSHITTGLPRVNGQVERLNRTIIAVLSKLTQDNPTFWFKYVPAVQQVINSTFHRSINTTPFELLIGTTMRNKTDLIIQQLIDEQLQIEYTSNRDLLRKTAKQEIFKVQNENKKYYNLRRKAPAKYQLNDLVAIKRTQYGPGMKLFTNFLGPYRIIKVKPNDTYDVEKCGNSDGPGKTNTCAEYLKPWPT